MRTLKELALQAIQVQDACNLSGIVIAWAAAVKDLRQAIVNATETGWAPGTEDVNRHPINQLWTSKVHELSGMRISDMEQYGKAYNACKEMAGLLTPPFEVVNEYGDSINNPRD